MATKKKPVKRRTKVGAKKVGSKPAVKKTISGIDKKHRDGLRILKDIDKLERDLANTKGTDAKNFLKRIINAKHDQLDALTKK